MYEFLEETVGDNMTKAVRSVTLEATVADLYRLFAADDFEAYPVVEDGKVVGMVSRLDVLKPFALPQDQVIPHYIDGMGTTIDKVMSNGLVTVGPETRLQRVLELMIEYRVRSVPVVDEQRKLLGIIARRDVMRAMERSVLPQYPPVLPFAEA